MYTSILRTLILQVSLKDAFCSIRHYVYKTPLGRVDNYVAYHYVIHSYNAGLQLRMYI